VAAGHAHIARASLQITMGTNLKARADFDDPFDKLGTVNLSAVA
jgi:hypothetical protein